MVDIKIDRLIRSHRKTIGLQITNDAKLIVRAPFFTPENYINKLVTQKKFWIKAKQDYIRGKQDKILAPKFVPGEKFLLLGQSYPLVALEDLPKAVVLGKDSLMISQVVLGNAQDHIECWYKTQALEYITQRVTYYSNITGLRYQSIRINSATTRWGSCGYKDTLNFTWKLIMAPARVVDYLVVHELMHIKQKNHSRKFWSEVRGVIVDYKQDEAWLKENSHFLAFSSS